MTQVWTVPGVPDSVKQQGWWLDGPAMRGQGCGKPGGGHGRLAAFVAIIVASDVLLYDQPWGLSLALFGAIAVAAALWVAPVRRIGGPVALALAGLLPVIEYVQALSVMLMGVLLISAVIWARADRVCHIGVQIYAVITSMPFLLVRDLCRMLWRWHTNPANPNGVLQVVKGWAMPVGGALILIALLAQANPVLHAALPRINDFQAGATVSRATFWFGVALVIWPVLTPPLPAPQHFGPARPRLGLTAQSALRALVMFNLIMGLQTVMDAGYLWGGLSLPDGMSHATYARRGAYPLLVTAILAGGFALLTRPFLAENGILRRLVLIWLAQNVVLTLSSAYRLALYVNAFGLTYLRFHAGIWMALVAIGLLLTVWQIARRRTNGWLLLRCTGMGFATLYVLAFVNVAQVIATYNLATQSKPDRFYLCSLGPMAAPSQRGLSSDRCVRSALGPDIDGWRDWGFRAWRVQRMLAQTVTEPAQ